MLLVPRCEFCLYTVVPSSLAIPCGASSSPVVPHVQTRKQARDSVLALDIFLSVNDWRRVHPSTGKETTHYRPSTLKSSPMMSMEAFVGNSSSRSIATMHRSVSFAGVLFDSSPAYQMNERLKLTPIRNSFCEHSGATTSKPDAG